jgi:hypothetical protein
MPAALLTRRCALTAPFHPYPGVAAGAVYSLWHFPSDGLKPGLPDVIRHTALRSSDFPPSSLAERERPSGPAANLDIICDVEVGLWALGSGRSAHRENWAPWRSGPPRPAFEIALIYAVLKRRSSTGLDAAGNLAPGLKGTVLLD